MGAREIVSRAAHNTNSSVFSPPGEARHGAIEGGLSPHSLLASPLLIFLPLYARSPAVCKGDIAGGFQTSLGRVTEFPEAVRGYKPVAVYAGSLTSGVLFENGVLATCGFGENGQTAQGAMTDSVTLTPTQGVPTGVRVVSAAMGGTHSAVITDQGVVMLAGLNNMGLRADRAVGVRGRAASVFELQVEDVIFPRCLPSASWF